MLVLSRKFGESFEIEGQNGGSATRITVTKGSGGSVKLNIEAPPEVSVIRQELLENGGDGKVATPAA